MEDIKKNYFKRLVDANDPASVKRFLGLVWSAYLMMASIVLLFISVPHGNESLLKDVIYGGFIILFVTLLGLTIETVGLILLKRAGMSSSDTTNNIADSGIPPVTTDNNTSNIIQTTIIPTTPIITPITPSETEGDDGDEVKIPRNND